MTSVLLPERAASAVRDATPADNAGLIVDTRNALRNVKGRRDHIVSA